MHWREKRPTKILDHKDYPTLGRYYLLFWHDVGYADQDKEEWKSAGFALQFEGLVEDYRQVLHPSCPSYNLFPEQNYELYGCG